MLKECLWNFCKFVELLGGTIWVENMVGKGNIFTFKLTIVVLSGDKDHDVVANDSPRLYHMAQQKIVTWHINYILEYYIYIYIYIYIK